MASGMDFKRTHGNRHPALGLALMGLLGLTACEFATNGVAPALSGEPAGNRTATEPLPVVQEAATTPTTDPLSLKDVVEPSATGESAVIPPGAPGSGLATGRPLINIRVTLTKVAYEQPLHDAVKAALTQRRNAEFDLVAVSPELNTPEDQAKATEIAKASGDQVTKSLIKMGLPEARINRIDRSDPHAATPMVQLYVR